MTLDVCCLVLTLISLQTADLKQTADFTSRGHVEDNVLAAPLVEGPGTSGEIGLWLLSTTTALVLERRNPRYRPLMMLLWIAVHAQTVRHNYRGESQSPVSAIIFPTMLLQF